MLLPGIVISRAPFTLSGTVIEPDATKVFPFGYNVGMSTGRKNKCLSDKNSGEEINCVKGYYMGGFTAVNNRNEAAHKLDAFKSIKYVNPSLFSKGWDTEPAKVPPHHSVSYNVAANSGCMQACPDGVTSCMMPLNINHVTLKCTGKPCGA